MTRISKRRKREQKSALSSQERRIRLVDQEQPQGGGIGVASCRAGSMYLGESVLQVEKADGGSRTEAGTLGQVRSGRASRDSPKSSDAMCGGCGAPLGFWIRCWKDLRFRVSEHWLSHCLVPSMDEDRPIYNVEDAMEEGRKKTKTGRQARRLMR